MTNSRVKLVVQSEDVHAYVVDVPLDSFTARLEALGGRLYVPPFGSSDVTSQLRRLAIQASWEAVESLMRLPVVASIAVEADPRIGHFQFQIDKCTTGRWSDRLGLDGLMIEVFELAVFPDCDQFERLTFQQWASRDGIMLDPSVQYPPMPVRERYFRENLKV